MLVDDHGRKVICTDPLPAPLIAVLDPNLVAELPPAVVEVFGEKK
jgi:alcohol dehydrogenase class IV